MSDFKIEGIIYGKDLTIKEGHAVIEIAYFRHLKQENEKKEKIIELLKKSNEFYSNRETWLAGCNIGFDCVSKDEMEYLDCGNLGAFKYGGKLAREIKKQVEELEK